MGVVEEGVDFGARIRRRPETKSRLLLRPPGSGSLAGVVEGAGEEAEGRGVDLEGDAGGEGHFAGVAEEAEAGDVGAAVTSSRSQAAALLRVSMEAMEASTWAGSAMPRLRAVEMTPVPRGLVK